MCKQANSSFTLGQGKDSLTQTSQLTAEHKVHFHMIPKPDAEQGLGVRWPQQKSDMDALKALSEDIKAKM